MSSQQGTFCLGFLWISKRKILLLFLSLFGIFACRNNQDKNVSQKTDYKPQIHPTFSDNRQLSYADSIYQLAEKYKAQSKTDSTVYWHKQALKIREELLKNHYKVVESYHAVASMYLKDFKYDVAAKYLEKAKTIAENSKTSSRLLIEIYFGLADCKRNMKDFPIAISLLEETKDLITRHFPGDKLLLAKCYHFLGGTYFNNKNYEKTIENVNAAIALAPSGEHRLLADFYTTLGMGYREIHQYSKALDSFEKSIKQDLSWTGPDSDPIAIRCIYKASVLELLEKFDSARYYLLKNLRIRRKIYGEKNVNTFGAKYSLAQFYEELGRHDSSTMYYHESLISLIKNFNTKNWISNPKPLNDEMNTDLIIGLVGKASSLKKMFQNDTARVDLLKLSLSTYFLADSVFTIFRRNFIVDDPQLAQLESGYIQYSEMMNVALKLHEKLNDFMYLQYAFTVMEKSRAVLLQNALMHAEAFNKARVPDGLRQEEKVLISSRQNILQHLSRNKSSMNSDSLQKALLSVNDRHTILLDKIKKINPQYLEIKYMEEPLKLETLMAFLKEKNSILLEFLWADKEIYSLIINSDTVITKIIALTPELLSAFKEINAELREKPNNIYDKQRFKAFCNNSNLLYKNLMGDLKNVIQSDNKRKSIIISADGPLQSFPFEVLITDNPVNKEVSYNLPYIFLEHPISYSLSSNLLMKQSRFRRNGQKLIAFAYSSGGLDHAKNKSANYQNLPGTEREISTIQRILENNQNRFYFADNSSESKFKKEVANFNLVHLALHGVGDTINELESHLIFRTEKDSVEDGQLYAHELYDLNLQHVDLAVLSACESGIGKHHKGEGVISIARSFAYGGCPSQVISLWRIDDHASAEMMESFYKHLEEGEEISVSLARAKRDYLAQANELSSHPAFWAAFIQMGDTSSLFNTTIIDWSLWAPTIFVIIIILLAGGFAFYRRLGRGRLTRIF